MHALFSSLVASKCYQLLYRSAVPTPRQRHSMGALTVRRPRETIPVNFRVVMNFDIAIDAAMTFGGMIEGEGEWDGGGE